MGWNNIIIDRKGFRKNMDYAYKSIYNYIVKKPIPSGRDDNGIIYSECTDQATRVGIFRNLAAIASDNPNSGIFNLDLRNLELLKMWLEINGYS